MPRPTHARIDDQALGANLLRLRQQAPASQLWAVVKANSYGHGLLQTAQALCAADGFALVEFDRALQLREAFPSHPILMLEGPFEPGDVSLALQHDIALTLHQPQQVRWVEQALEHCDSHRRERALKLPFHVKFNSGMNRLGFDRSGFVEAVTRLQGAGLGKIVLMTHFADADRKGGAESAWQRFGEVRHAAQHAVGATAPYPFSASNSAALFSMPDTHGAWVRPGIALYGATPFDHHQPASRLGLQAAMGLYSELIAIQSLQAGDAVGYGSTFVAERAMRIGVVACGYADGYPRHAPTGTPVLVDGVRVRTVGRVAMDMLMVDLSAVPQAGIGSSVELWGKHLSVDEVAWASGTIGYELLCALAARVPVSREALR
jgi:alanine racemase